MELMQNLPIPIFSAHRGAADLAPENTLPALEKALDLGIQMIEIDVRPSRDGIFYDLHDPRVNRTTDGRGRIRWMKSSRIDKLDGGSHFSPRFKGVPIPTVESVMSAFQDRALFYFDVKIGTPLKGLIGLVRKYQLEKRSIFWFKDPSEAKKLKTCYPEFFLKVNASSPEMLLSRISDFNPDIIECSSKEYSRNMYHICQSRGIKLMVSFQNREKLYVRNPSSFPADIINVHNVKPLITLLKKNQGAPHV